MVHTQNYLQMKRNSYGHSWRNAGMAQTLEE